ncbi:MAG: UDP-3-O-[3-hydroxymyristoyl] N-acetylglucosamine deacetylase [Candidatus Brocadiae bacterium]|nr:UDP-3-O-[3-hydroxymyristoyl] N-acetylglucosamine deacetylase [Candidatus Brocadiia bacterium]
MRLQRTISRPAEIEGIGLFSGERTRLRISPAPVDAGVTFTRLDLPGRPRIPVNANTATIRPRRTAIQKDGAEVETVEHLLAAMGGLSIDNLEVEVNGAEIPGGDGSSAPFVDALTSAGIVEQDKPKPVYQLREAIHVRDGEQSIVAMPSSEGLTVSYTLNHENLPFHAQHYTLSVNPESFAQEIAPARTWCLSSEVDELLRQGFGKGCTTQNTLVVNPHGDVRENTLRFPDELVRHKILDIVGDLYLAGSHLRAHIVAVRSGHSVNHRLVQEIHRQMQGLSPLPKKPAGTMLDVREILKILPHRFPFLLIDKVLELDSYRRAVGIKNVTYNEPFFQGHFPQQPIMPGVLQIEAMAQLAGALLMRKAENQNKLAVLLSIDACKLRKTVVPGDQLRIEAEALKIKARTAHVYTKCTVDGQMVSEAQMKFMIVESDDE